MTKWTYERVADLFNTQLEDQEFIEHSFRVFPCRRGIFGGYEYLGTEFILHLTNFRIILEKDQHLNRKLEGLITDFINLAHYMKYEKNLRKESKAKMNLLKNSSISVLYSQIERFELQDGRVRVYPKKKLINRDLNIFFGELDMFTFSASPAYIENTETNSESSVISNLIDYLSPPDKDLSEELVKNATTLSELVRDKELNAETYDKLESLYAAKTLEEPDFIQWEVGDKVSNEKFGVGTITKKFGYGKYISFGINFERLGTKIIDPKAEKLRKIED